MEAIRCAVNHVAISQDIDSQRTKLGQELNYFAMFPIRQPSVFIIFLNDCCTGYLLSSFVMSWGEGLKWQKQF